VIRPGDGALYRDMAMARRRRPWTDARAGLPRQPFTASARRHDRVDGDAEPGRRDDSPADRAEQNCDHSNREARPGRNAGLLPDVVVPGPAAGEDQVRALELSRARGRSRGGAAASGRIGGLLGLVRCEAAGSRWARPHPSDTGVVRLPLQHPRVVRVQFSRSCPRPQDKTGGCRGRRRRRPADVGSRHINVC
jgi:hypothetical protein